jgi:hypothetical protein
MHIHSSNAVNCRAICDQLLPEISPRRSAAREGEASLSTRMLNFSALACRANRARVSCAADADFSLARVDATTYSQF